MSGSELLVQVARGGLVESVHRGHIAVVDRSLKLKASAGSPAATVFIRSSAKPLQTIPLLETGAADRFGLSPEEIAVICSSHSGEPLHAKTVRSVLDKIGMTARDLQCGSGKLPSDAGDGIPKETSLYDTCSGKHAGMLAMCVHLQESPSHYLSGQHPVQKLIRETVGDLCQFPHMTEGIDGCGSPVYGMPLQQLAIGYMRMYIGGEHIAFPRHQAGLKIISAIRRHPYFLAGIDRFDTRLAEVTGGAVIGKMGAEGVFALVCPDADLAMAVKIEDGAERALYPAVVEALVQLGILNEIQLEQLASHHNPVILNRRNEAVGAIMPAFSLNCR